MTETSNAIPAKQTAIVQDEHGHAILNHDSPVPQLRDGCVLVKTVAVALNPSDYKMGAAFPSAGATVGTDFAGHIVAIHASVAASTPFSTGDAVCGISHGSNPSDHHSGAFGQFVLAQAELLLRVNEAWLPLSEAAALGTALFTACAALWGSLSLPAKPKLSLSLPRGGDDLPVLVYGGSTACGSMAVQLLSL
jgi:NADPH:quinone reductase-like Zn-dependent oxidoreductase